MRTNLKQTIAIIKMEILPKRKDKLTVVLKCERVLKALYCDKCCFENRFKCNCECFCCEIDENCRGGNHFVIDVIAAAAAKNRNSIKYS